MAEHIQYQYHDLLFVMPTCFVFITSCLERENYITRTDPNTINGGKSYDSNDTN